MIALLLVDPHAGTFAGAMLPDELGDTASFTTELAEHFQPALRFQAARCEGGAVFVHVPED